MALSSNGKDVAPSRRKSGFDSPWGYQRSVVRAVRKRIANPYTGDARAQVRVLHAPPFVLVAQADRARGSYPRGRWSEANLAHHGGHPQWACGTVLKTASRSDAARGFESLALRLQRGTVTVTGRPHKPNHAGSSPVPATRIMWDRYFVAVLHISTTELNS